LIKKTGENREQTPGKQSAKKRSGAENPRSL